MRKMFLMVLLSSIFAAPVFADDMDWKVENKDCGVIAKACKSAGFKDMGFWTDCMKPVLMDKEVKKVKVDAAVVKECRAFKIDKMKKELEDLESVK